MKRRFTIDLWLVLMMAIATLGGAAAVLGGVSGRAAGAVLVIAVFHALNRAVGSVES